MKKILREIDRLEEDCEKIKHIREVVKQLRQRVDAASIRLDKVAPSNYHSRANPGAARSDPRRR